MTKCLFKNTLQLRKNMIATAKTAQRRVSFLTELNLYKLQLKVYIFVYTLETHMSTNIKHKAKTTVNTNIYCLYKYVIIRVCTLDINK